MSTTFMLFFVTLVCHVFFLASLFVMLDRHESGKLFLGNFILTVVLGAISLGFWVHAVSWVARPYHSGTPVFYLQSILGFWLTLCAVYCMLALDKQLDALDRDLSDFSKAGYISGLSLCLFVGCALFADFVRGILPHLVRGFAQL